MIKKGSVKLNYVSGNSLTTIRYLSAQPGGTVPDRNAINARDMESYVEDEVQIKEFGNKGVIMLNRLRALNALNLSMVEKMYPVLKQWESTKKLVIIEGAGDKAFCAGGDVKSIVNALRDSNNSHLGEEFFKKEYTMNHLIGTYKIPYIALMNGITMGGGVGLSVHGKYRVATERTLFSMPETAIGLFPDVGGSYFLPRLKGKLGLYLGLTGQRLSGIDVLLAGIATHFVRSDKLVDLKQELLTTEEPDVKQILDKYQPKDFDPKFCLSYYTDKIDKYFTASTVEKIVDRLWEDNSKWAGQTLALLSRASPTSLKVTKRAIETGHTLNLADCLKMEYRLACAALDRSSDFSEGVRALLIDKDRTPKWNPGDLRHVTDDYVNKLFTRLSDEKELQL